MADENKTQSVSDVKATQAGATTGATQTEAGSAGRASGAETGRAQAGAGAGYQSAGAETISDVGQAEAYLINMKRLVAGELDLDAQLRSNALRIIRNAEDFDGNVRQIALQNLQLGQQALANAVALANRVNNGAIDLDTRIKQEAVSSDGRRQDNAETHDKQCDAVAITERERTARTGDVMDVIREMGLSENPTFQDAIVAKVIAKLGGKPAA